MEEIAQMAEPSWNANMEVWVEYAAYLGVDVDGLVRRDDVRKTVMLEMASRAATAIIVEVELTEDEQIEALIAEEAADAVEVDPETA